jgi:hypothetical protein
MGAKRYLPVELGFLRGKVLDTTSVSHLLSPSKIIVIKKEKERKKVV